MLNKFNRKFLYVNILLIGGLALAVAVSAFTGPTAAPPTANPAGVLPLLQGGTGTAAADAAAARGALGAAGAGANSDITSLTGTFTTPLSVSRGGTGLSSVGSSGNVLTSNGTSWTSSAAAGVPSGAVSFFNLDTCPTGWTALTEAQGRYLVGLPSGGTRAATVGTALSNTENRAVG